MKEVQFKITLHLSEKAIVAVKGLVILCIIIQFMVFYSSYDGM
jgi:hypothetical protein